MIGGEAPRPSLLFKAQLHHLLSVFLGKFLNVMVAQLCPLCHENNHSTQHVGLSEDEISPVLKRKPFTF